MRIVGRRRLGRKLDRVGRVPTSFRARELVAREANRSIVPALRSVSPRDTGRLGRAWFVRPWRGRSHGALAVVENRVKSIRTGRYYAAWAGGIRNRARHIQRYRTVLRQRSPGVMRRALGLAIREEARRP